MHMLTMKQRLFVDEYLKDFNASQACCRAGYKTRNPNDLGAQLLRKTQHIIDQHKAELMEQAKLTLEDWVQRVNQLAWYDPRKFFDSHNKFKEVSDLDALSAQCLGAFEAEALFEGRGTSRKQVGLLKKVKLLDRTPYVLLLGKYLNAFSEKKPQGSTTSPPSRLPTESLSVEQRMAFRNELVALLKRYNLPMTS